VRFDVVRLHIQAESDRLKNSELISHGVEHFLVAIFSSLRPKFSRSKKLGCAPTATPCFFAAETAACIVSESPA
jgi:hypothetical protein